MKRAPLLILFVASLQGSCGVALAAAAAHVESSANIATASQFLMLHAAAGLALGAIASLNFARAQWCVGAAFALQAGVTLFALDLTCRTFLGTRLFPYAAPIGGSLTIASWLALSVWAIAELVSPGPSVAGKNIDEARGEITPR
jgi:uncharacterized membrane protein YgdD (TMEM256/DUF423 family)